ncbi:hypothetical protein A1U1_00195 [Escherichia coli KTE64]|nr:hypothetical protein A1U1_00195 [Escherichia coli KTE64]
MVIVIIINISMTITTRGGYDLRIVLKENIAPESGNDSNLLVVFYVQIMPDDFVMQLHRF